jgi:hypothetical protein
LREVIARRDLAAGELAEAEKAVQATFERGMELGGQIADMVERRRASADMAHGDGGGEAVLVEALLSGRDLPVDELPTDEALRSLQAEHASLHAARKRLAPVVAARKAHLEFTGHRGGEGSDRFKCGGGERHGSVARPTRRNRAPKVRGELHRRMSSASVSGGECGERFHL